MQIHPEDIRIIQSFNTSVGLQTQGRFFKRTQEQANTYKSHTSQQLNLKKKQKILEKVKKIEELKQQILMLQQDQIQEQQQQ